MKKENIFTRMSKKDKEGKASKERRRKSPQIYGTVEPSARDVAVAKELERREKKKKKEKEGK